MKQLYFLIGLCILNLAGCSSESSFNEPKDNDAFGYDESLIWDESWEVTDRLELTESEKALMTNINEFGYKLMCNYSNSSTDGSFNVSPISVSVYLGMMANAISGDARGQIISIFGADDLNALNSAGTKLMHYLPCKENGVCLGINNRIWLSNRYTASPELLSDLKQLYNADVECVDFHLPGTVDAINQWVSEKTKGLIKGILFGEHAIYSELSEVSANTVYFKGDWNVKFDKSKTKRDSFNTPSGNKKVDMMKGRIMTGYAYAEGFKMVKLEYENSKNVMELYLPPAYMNPKSIVMNMTPELQDRLISGMAPYMVNLSMPRFESKSSMISLDNFLVNLCISDLYSADFSPLGINDPHPLHVAHQTYIKVDEEGTELAGVTGGICIANSGDGIELPEVSVDFNRPFMYIVRNCQTGAILMAGVVTNP